MNRDLRPAAAVLLWRAGQVWLGQRGQTRFLPGFWVFPGGGAEPEETFLQAAQRELREETGLAPGSSLRPLARAITPAYAPVRYDCRVFAWEVPEEAEPQVDGRELVQGRWLTIEQALTQRQLGELPMVPPTYAQLRRLERCRQEQRWPSEEEAFALPEAREQEILTMADGITVVPLRSPTIPPAAWTNSVLVGRQRYFLVDPGGEEPEVLAQELARRREAGGELAGVVLTHHHPDHLLGYLPLGLQELPLYCHPRTAELLPSGFPRPRELHDGERLAVDGELSLMAHWTPGHAPGHLALEVPERRTLLAADLVSSLSSIVIPTSNGDLSAYLDSLLRMRQRECRLVIPGHGPPFGQDSDPFGTAWTHRQHREEQLLELLARQGRTCGLKELTSLLYRGLDPRLSPAAQANTWHHLQKLAREGRVQEEEQGWSLTPAPG